MPFSQTLSHASLEMAFGGRRGTPAGKSGPRGHPHGTCGTTSNSESLWCWPLQAHSHSVLPGLREEALTSPLANKEWHRLGNGQFYPKGNSLFLIFKESYFNTIPGIPQDKICPISFQTSSKAPVLFHPVRLPTPRPSIRSQSHRFSLTGCALNST